MKQIINSKRYFKFGELLENILKHFVGWNNSSRNQIGKKLS